MSVRDREQAVVAGLQSLAPHLDGEPDPAYREATRARLVAMAAVRTPDPGPVPFLRRLLHGGATGPARRRARLTAGLAGAALTVTASATLVAVAADARPGEVLYDVKRGTEQAQLALAGDARGRTLLDLAGTRLEELRSLVEDGARTPPRAELVVQALETMDAQTTEGASLLTQRAVTTGDADPVELLADWTAAQTAGLAVLQGDVPPAVADEVAASLGLLSEVADRVSELDVALHCTAGPATAGADELGPVPVLCPPDGSTVPGPEAPEGSVPGAVPQAPATGTSAASPRPGPALPSVGGSLPGVPGSAMEGGEPTPAAPAVPAVPTGPVPSPPDPSVPVSVPPLPAATSAPMPSLPVDVCPGPVSVGDC